MTDSQGLTDSQAFEISITNTNRPPTANAIQIGDAHVGDRIDLDGSASSDPDGDTLNYSWALINRPSGSEASLSDANQSISALQIDRHGTYEVHLSVDDGDLDNQTELLVIQTLNRPPTADNLTVDGKQNASAQINLTANDPDSDVLAYIIVIEPSHGTLEGEAPNLTYVPSADFLGEDSFQFRTDDGYGGSDTASVTLSISLNNPPQITSMPLIIAGVDYAYHYPVIATDPDGDALVYELNYGPAGMSIDQTSGLVSWVPDGEQVKDHGVSIQLSDGYGGIDSQTFWIRVTAENSASGNKGPIAHAGGDFTVEEGMQSNLDGSSSYDENGDRLRFQWRQVSGPAVALSNIYSSTPQFDAPAVDRNALMRFELSVSDQSVSSLAEVNVMVLNMDVWPDGDGMVTNCADSGPGSLLEALEYANENPGTRVTFSIPDTDTCYKEQTNGSNVVGYWELHSPDMWETRGDTSRSGTLLLGDGTFIDGESQAENKGDRNPFGPEVVINQAGLHRPLTIHADDIVIRGLVFNQNNYPTSATVTVITGDNIIFEGNYFGVDPTGQRTVNPGNDVHAGIRISDHRAPLLPGNVMPGEGEALGTIRIGGSRLGQGNLFGAVGTGVEIAHSRQFYELGYTFPEKVIVQGNKFGTDPSGELNIIQELSTTGWAAISVNDSVTEVQIGGTEPGAGNQIVGLYEGIRVGSERIGFGKVTIQGNRIGNNASGSVELNNGKGYNGISVSGSLSQDTLGFEGMVLIGGALPGEGNQIVGYSNIGIQITDRAHKNLESVIVKGNLLGTDDTGTGILGNNGWGIYAYGCKQLQLGGSETGAGNVIGGHSSEGVRLEDDSNSVCQAQVQGNRIGVGKDELTPIPNEKGILQEKLGPTLIGGLNPGEGNIIANNRKHGIELAREAFQGAQAQILGNLIYDNGGLGITRDGSVKLNDAGDADLLISTSRAQNFPVITSVSVENGMSLVEGILDTVKPEQCIIELFSSPTRDPEKYGEGRTWLLALRPDTDGTFTTLIPQDFAGQFLTSVATRVNREPGDPVLISSEFSKAVPVWTGAALNNPPIIEPKPTDTTATAETGYTYEVTASDPDGDSLNYSLALAPDGMAIDTDGVISWTPTVDQQGQHRVTVLVRDDKGLYDSWNYAIDVLPLVDTEPPRVTASLADVTSLDSLLEIEGTIFDHYLVEYEIHLAPEGTDNYVTIGGGETNVDNGVLGALDPTRLANGIYDLQIIAYDEGGLLTVYPGDPLKVDVSGQLKIGQFSLAFQDIAIPVSGIPITVTRSYNSFNKTSGDFGIGWDMVLGSGIRLQVTRPLGYDWSVEPDVCVVWNATGECQLWDYKLVTNNIPKVLVTYADGQQDRFEFSPYFSETGDEDIDPEHWKERFIPLGNTTATLESQDGPELYVPGGTGDKLLVPGDFDIFNPDLYRLTTKDGTTFLISVTDGLRKITDRNGNSLIFNSDGISHSSGLAIGVVRDGQGRIVEITDPMGNFVFYEYDERGDLVGFTNQEDELTQFGYDAEHNLNSITDPRNIEILQVAYDENGRMIGSVDGLGQSNSVEHDINNVREIIRDRNGNKTIYEYDENGNIVKEIAELDGLEYTTSFSFDDRGNMLTKTDAANRASEWTYDSNNNKLSETGPRGTSSWTYNVYGQVETHTNPEGHKTTNEYDGSGNLTKVIDPEGWVTEYQNFDSSGNARLKIDWISETENLQTRYTFDGAGNLSTETDPLENQTTYTHDSSGNRLSETRTRTRLDGTAETLVTRYEYNQAGRRTRTIDALNEETVISYNKLGKEESIRDKNGNLTSISYDDVGNLVGIRFTDGSSSFMTYDAEGQEESSTDRDGRTTCYEYDSLGRRTRTLYPGLGENCENASIYTETTYDAAGRTLSQRDRRGNLTQYAYPTDSEQTVIDPYNNTTHYLFDSQDRRIEMTDANNHKTKFEYDSKGNTTKITFHDNSTKSTVFNYMGKKLSETDQAGRTTLFGYDGLGRLMQVTQSIDDGSNIITNFERDEIGNLIGQTDAENNTTRMEYDAMGRVVKRIRPMGETENFSYDATGNAIFHTDFNGRTTESVYDENNRLIKKVYQDGSEVQFSYTPQGLRTRAGEEYFEYDALGHLIAVTDEHDNVRLSYEYDTVGNRTAVVTHVGRTAYTFDKLNRLASVTDPDDNTTTYGYDTVGNRASVTYPNDVTTTYSYDELNRLVLLENTGPAGLISGYDYTLGSTGNRIRVEESGSATNGRAVDYLYDGVYRLVKESIDEPGNDDDRTIAYEYDDVGNRLQRKVKVGNRTSTTLYAYDDNDRLLSEQSSVAFAGLGGWKANHNIAAVTAFPAIHADKYYVYGNLSFMMLALVAPVAGGINLWFGLGGMQRGNRRRRLLIKNGANQIIIILIAGSLVFDPRVSYALSVGEYPGEAPVLAGAADPAVSEAYYYEWDDNGNMVSRSDGVKTDVYVYDDENRLVAATIENGSSPGNVDYEYDADGIRVAKTVDGMTTAYLVDKNRDYAQVLVEDDGTVVVSYVYGDDLISMLRPDTGVSFYLYDGQMSVRLLLDGAGNSADKYRYDAFGILLNTSGDTDNHHLYSGENYDSSVGYYYLRARYMSVADGRFFSIDKHDGNLYDPYSLHRYVYVESNPVNNIDPSGNSLVAIMTAIGIIGIVSALLQFSKRSKRASCLVRQQQWCVQMGNYILDNGKTCDAIKWLDGCKKNLPLAIGGINDMAISGGEVVGYGVAVGYLPRSAALYTLISSFKDQNPIPNCSN